MPSVSFGSHVCQLHDGETVLDGLLRHGIPVAHACKAGSCGSCILRVVSGTIPDSAQSGLKDSWRAQGCFLPCVCRPVGDLALAEPGVGARAAARIASLRLLSADVIGVRIAPEQEFEYRPGQYLTLFATPTLARSYSIASLPSDGCIELHVRRTRNGLMSGWLFTEAQPGDPVQLQGPLGDCFYTCGNEDQPLLLAGTGTGLAPLYGVLRDALSFGHRGPIMLFHGALGPEGLYLGDELRSLSSRYPNFTYTPTTDPIDRVVAAQVPKTTGYRAFVCGDPAVVQLLKRKIFLAGAAMREIHSDAFLPAIL